MVLLRLQNIAFSYASRKVLNNVEFSVGSGELVGILGPNGAGKTTLLKAIDRIIRPETGAVLIDEYDINMLTVHQIAKTIAVVPQDTFTNPNLTGLEVVLIGRSPHLPPLQIETAEDIRIAMEAMRMTSCLHLADRKVNELSGGERRRIILARALAQEPRILLLDEPTMNLDVNSQIELMESIVKICRAKGITILSTFHDLNLAARFSDNIILLNQGRIFALGRPEEVLTANNLRRVFKVEAEIIKHPAVGLALTIISAFHNSSSELTFTD